MGKLKQVYEILVPQAIRGTIERKLPIPAWIAVIMIAAVVVLGLFALRTDKEPLIGLANSKNLEIMAGPGIDYRKIEDVSYGSPVILLKDNGEWIFVKTFSGKKGWVEKDLVKLFMESPKKKVEVESAPEIRYVKLDKMNLRNGPGVGYNSIGIVSKNEAVEKLELYGGWCRVKTPEGIVGWLNSKYLTAEKTN